MLREGQCAGRQARFTSRKPECASNTQAHKVLPRVACNLIETEIT